MSKELQRAAGRRELPEAAANGPGPGVNWQQGACDQEPRGTLCCFLCSRKSKENEGCHTAAQTELRGNKVQVGKGLSLGSCRKLLPQPACRECHVCVPVPSLQVAPCSTICCIRSISRAPQVS